MSISEPNQQQAMSPQVVSAPQRSWLPHAVIGILAMIIVGIDFGQGRSDEQLRLLAFDSQAEPQARCSAIRMLAARPSANPARIKELRSLAFDSNEPNLQFLGAGSDLQRDGARERMGPPPRPRMSMEKRLAARFPLDTQDWLWFVAYRRKVGGMQIGARRRLDLREAQWTLAALAGEPIPSDLVQQHIQARLQASARPAR